VGSGSFGRALARRPPGLSLAAVALALAVIVRMALVPLHGWLLQVMEAPTPVSALLHAGVVNLGGFVLIRFAPCWRPRRRPRPAGGGRPGQRLLAAFAMLTRISIKVRLAWSTVAQMGFWCWSAGWACTTWRRCT
jgi:NAD(P)H-quinone oxidoreductase subunit 5